MGKSKHKNKQIGFIRKHVQLGNLIAENDPDLNSYYIGQEKYVDRALNMDDPAVFFMGPKGAGKSAILQMVRLLKEHDSKRIINLSPDDLAFTALANLDIKHPLLSDDDDKMQWLFKILWDYVLLIEIWGRENPEQGRFQSFMAMFNLSSGEDKARIQRLYKASVSDNCHRTFTDRIISLFEEIQINTELPEGPKLQGAFKLNQPAKSRLSKNEPIKLLNEINHAVKNLPKILKNEYYILIDDLDLHWVNDQKQNNFIAALFLSLRKLSHRPFKFVVSIREDIFRQLPLVDKDKTRGSVCKVKWDVNSLKEMIEGRISRAFKCSRHDVWNKVFQRDVFVSLNSHTTMQPRENIRMIQLCLDAAYSNGHKKVHENDIAEALKNYSEERRDDLVSEIGYKYKKLDIILNRFNGWDKEFGFDKLAEIAFDLELERMDQHSLAPWTWAGQFGENPKGFIRILLEIGFLQVKPNRSSRPEIYERSKHGEINNRMWFAVTPMYGPGLSLLGVK